MERLSVYWNKTHAGWLTRHTRGRLQFRYAGEWLSTVRQPISLSLPCREETHAPAVSTAFFENLLPETDARSILAFNMRFDKKDTFAFLEHFGQDCAGALSILPEGRTPDFTPGQYENIDLALAEALDRIAASPGETQLLPEMKNARLSIAGAQDKLPVYMKDSRIYLPLNPGSATTHIIKPASPSFRHIQRNEAFCMALARSAGLNTPESRLITVNGHELFAIERYDREKTNDTVHRIHQEDFCQALGIPVARKYQEGGGPGFSRCRDLADEFLSDQGPQVRMDLAAVTLFNYVIGNHDAHGKNFSIIHGRNMTLAPFYDLVSTQIYPGLEDKFAMAIGKTFRHDRITEKAFAEFARDMGMRPEKLAGIIAGLAASVSQGYEPLLSAHETRYGASPVYERLSNVIQKNLAQLMIFADRLTRK